LSRKKKPKTDEMKEFYRKTEDFLDASMNMLDDEWLEYRVSTKTYMTKAESGECYIRKQYI